MVSKEFPTALKKENVAVNDQIKVFKNHNFSTNTPVLIPIFCLCKIKRDAILTSVQMSWTLSQRFRKETVCGIPWFFQSYFYWKQGICPKS